MAGLADPLEDYAGVFLPPDQDEEPEIGPPIPFVKEESKDPQEA